MPDLSALSPKALLSQILNLVLAGGGPTDPVPRLYATAFVRLADKTLREYETARVEMEEFVTTPSSHLSPYFTAIGHFETCVHSLHRALCFLERLRRVGLKRNDGTPLVPRDNAFRPLSATVRDAVREMRDGIEHLDDDLLKLKIPWGGSNTVRPLEDRLRLNQFEIAYSELGQWVTSLHELAEDIARYRPPPVAS
jgi:hypothetical protein